MQEDELMVLEFYENGMTVSFAVQALAKVWNLVMRAAALGSRTTCVKLYIFYD